jgi:hypothetical protein
MDDPKPDVCSYFDCIDNFWNGKGYMMQCQDGMVSMSGGRPGSCSYHGATAARVCNRGYVLRALVTSAIPVRCW